MAENAWASQIELNKSVIDSMVKIKDILKEMNDRLALLEADSSCSDCACKRSEI